LAIVTMANGAYGDSRLLYAEAQLVAGYDFSNMVRHRLQFYSMDQMDVMQKPSVGFDLVQRLSTETGDWGLLAVQARFAYDPTRNGNVEPQLYNAYLKVKPGFGDIWVGHNKPAFGLSMSLDNHGTLLQPLSMSGYGFDRDWGAGYYRDFESGNVAFSATLGAGMGIYTRGNYLFSGRFSKGDLNQQNYNVGLSASYGKILETMGYHTSDWIQPLFNDVMLAADASVFTGRWENRLETLWSRKVYRSIFQYSDTTSTYLLFHRVTLNLTAENRLKIEIQDIWDFSDPSHNTELNIGASYLLTPDLTIRSYAMDVAHPRLVAQLYWYHKL
jgi:hypothetical protein